MIRRLLKRNMRERKIQQEKDKLFWALANHVWNNALFMDNQGRTGNDRNSEETGAHWDKFHEIYQEYRQLRIKELEHEQKSANDR